MTSSGFKVISENGRIFCVGNPFCIVLNWNVTGVSPSSLLLKKTSHLVKKTPVSSSTKNDCARGSYQPTRTCLDDGDPTWVLEITWVPIVVFIALLSNTCLSAIFAFLTEIILSWTVSNVPLEINCSVAIVVAEFWSFKLLLMRVKDLVPVSNFGWMLLVGSGINKLPINVADKSEISLTSVIDAWAPLVSPIKVIPLSTYPLYPPWVKFARENISTFRIFDVEE